MTTTAYLQERIFRTKNGLAVGIGELRIRLPIAYDIGLGTIGISEIGALSPKAARMFRSISSRLSAVEDNELGWAVASANQMSDADLIELTSDILSFAAFVDTEIENRKGKK